MAKDQSSKSLARTSYEKISKVTFGFSRRISHCPKKNNTANPSQSTIEPPTVKPLVSHTPSVSSHQLPTPKNESLLHPPEVKPPKKLVRFLSSNIKKNGDDGGKALAGQKTFSEEKYNSYIDRTKMKMRAPSTVSGGRTLSRRESLNDMFSGYINRTKLKLRTTSSVDTSKWHHTSTLWDYENKNRQCQGRTYFFLCVCLFNT